MRRIQCLTCMVVAGVLFVGCSREGEKKASTTPKGATTSVEPTKPTPRPAEAAPKIEEASKAVTSAVDAGVKAVEESKAQTPAPEPAATPAKEAAPKPAAAGEEFAKQAQSQLDRIVQAIKDGKLDDAQKLLTELEAKKGSLPASLQDRVAGARKSLDAAKLAEGAKSALPKTAPKNP